MSTLNVNLPLKQGSVPEDGEVIYDADDVVFASTENVNAYRRTSAIERDENEKAAFIVKACNAHGDMVKALNRLADAHIGDSEDFLSRRQIARDVLAKHGLRHPTSQEKSK